MNSEMTTISKLSTNETMGGGKQQKQKLSKQLEQNRIREMDTKRRVFSWEGEGRNREERYREEEA